MVELAVDHNLMDLVDHLVVALVALVGIMNMVVVAVEVWLMQIDYLLRQVLQLLLQ
jgi:hypothetical protein